MAEKATIGNFFKFLRDKEDREIPLKAQFSFTPDAIDWDGLAYNLNDLNLIKQTDNAKNIVWDKVNQSDFNVLNWVIQNAPDNLDIDKIDINQKGILSRLNKYAPDQIPYERLMVSGYVQAMHALRSAKDKIDWDTQFDYDDPTGVSFMMQNAPELLSLGKIDRSNPKMVDILSKYGKK